MKITIPETCENCHFNYNNVLCRLYDKYLSVYQPDDFNCYESKPSWCEVKELEEPLKTIERAISGFETIFGDYESLCKNTMVHGEIIPFMPTPENPKDGTNKTPHRCPVCGGCGNVPNGFYGPYNIEGDRLTWTSSGTAMETCKSCGGSGIIWN